MKSMNLSFEEKERFKEAIKEYLKTNKSARAIGREFNFSKDRVSNYLNRHKLMRPKKDNSYDTTFFKKIDTEEKAYWLGFLYADGSITNSNGRNSVDLTLASKDKDHLVKFKKSLKYKGDISHRVIAGKYHADRLAIHGEEIVLDLIDKGCIPNKSLTLEFPKISSILERHFLRGYFDGDGSVFTYKAKGCEKPKLCISVVGSHSFLSSFQDIIVRETGATRVNLYNDKITVWDYKKAWNEALKVLHYLYDDSQIFLTRKKEIFMDYCRLYK